MSFSLKIIVDHSGSQGWEGGNRIRRERESYRDSFSTLPLLTVCTVYLIGIGSEDIFIFAGCHSPVPVQNLNSSSVFVC